ncbi:unnamed protein product [Plutella xylostella]|uniref:(diamondback moth) hypothetical protein n=1 Tax=Plutella xylostella TaxID=51655 RepID=A0A8S4EFC2_PLUXY|nr:unnamed protein product [Plutella xylostella]
MVHAKGLFPNGYLWDKIDAELLREKQHHLERLMRERELERSEVAKVTLQADRAETALAQIKKEATQKNSISNLSS